MQSNLYFYHAERSAEDIYPVNFSPSSWASYLSTDFEPKDLLMDSDAIRTKLLVAEESREFWMQRKAELEASIQNIDSLVDKMKNARVAYTVRAQQSHNFAYPPHEVGFPIRRLLKRS